MANPENQTPLEHYISDLYAPEDDLLRWVRDEMKRQEMPEIQIQPFEGRLLQFLMRAVNAKTVLEIGALAGYSGVWMARALPDGGKLISLEASSKHAAITRATFERAGLADRTEVIEGAALDSMQSLTDRAPFDFVFIDADKASYPQYLAWSVAHLREGGMVTAHNAFRGGRVLNYENGDDRIMDEFNRALADHPQLESFIIGVGDGMAAGIKK